MPIDWKDAFKTNAATASQRLHLAAQTAAAAFLAELSATGISCRTEDGKTLLVRGKPTPEQAARIKAQKPELLAALQAGRTEPANRTQWKAGDLSIQVSISKSGIVDFIVGPRADGCAGTEMPAELEALFLEAAAPSWTERVRALGGLRVYSLSQWAVAEPAVQRAVSALEGVMV